MRTTVVVQAAAVATAEMTLQPSVEGR
jgi:hypothetical protein